MPLARENIKTLVEWLGAEGAQAGLEHSHMTIADLRVLLESMGKSAPSKVSRRELIAELLFGATKRIEKTLDELLAMNGDELLAYFEQARPSRTELLSILSELDFRPGSEAQKSLYKYAARQISETGLFQRVAGKTSSPVSR